MIDSCDVQKNVNMTIKDGLKIFLFFILEEKDKHQAVDRRNSNLEIALGYTVYNCEERNRRREHKHSMRLDV